MGPMTMARWEPDGLEVPRQPLDKQNQLCFADATSVDIDDFVKVTLHGQVPLLYIPW